MSANQHVIQQIQERNFFDKHVIERVANNTWLCHKKSTRTGSFYVVVPPGAIILYGDMGEIIFNANFDNPLKWGKEQFKSEDTYYAMTRLARAFRHEVFQERDATAYLQERLQEAQKSGYDSHETARCQILLDEWEEITRTSCREELEAKWWGVHTDHGDGDAPGMRGYGVGIYWSYQCLCWFFSQVDLADDRFKDKR